MGQQLGYYWPEANPTWRILNCIQNVKYGEKLEDPDIEFEGGFNWVECT